MDAVFQPGRTLQGLSAGRQPRGVENGLDLWGDLLGDLWGHLWGDLRRLAHAHPERDHGERAVLLEDRRGDARRAAHLDDAIGPSAPLLDQSRPVEDVRDDGIPEHRQVRAREHVRRDPRRITKPGLFIETTGATSDPSPLRPQRSLKGAKASRVIRALVEWRPPFRLTEIAARSLVDAGHVSRMLAQLEQEGLLTRMPRGAVTEVNWEELIRRWAQEYTVTKSNAATYMIEPRGLASLLAGLRTTTLRYALTGSVAASMCAAVAPAALAMLYVEDRRAAADELKLRPADSGDNVVLLVPKDPLPFEGTTRQQDLVLAAPSQVAADLLTGPGRSSSEAEAFLDWMKENEDAWRR